MKRVLVVAVHPDDEVLGAGGTLLKHIHSGDEVHWLIVTSAEGVDGYDAKRLEKRRNEIKSVERAFGFKQVHELGLPAAQLDSIPRSEIISKLKSAIEAIRPDTMYVPWGGDAHADHGVTLTSLRPLLKSFRFPWLKTVLAMETLSETNEALLTPDQVFTPNWWVDVADFKEKKIEIMKLYDEELKEPPFPRSLAVINSLMVLRGSQISSSAAESFRLIFHRENA